MCSRERRELSGKSVNLSCGTVGIDGRDDGIIAIARAEGQPDLHHHVCSQLVNEFYLWTDGDTQAGWLCVCDGVSGSGAADGQGMEVQQSSG